MSRPFSTMMASEKHSVSIRESSLDYDSGCYYSPCYVIRYDEEEIIINEMVFFRVEIEAYRDEEFSASVFRVRGELRMCELADYKEQLPACEFRVLAEFEGRTARASRVHSFLPVQFERRFIGMLDGLLDLTILEFKFRSKTPSEARSFGDFLREATNGFSPASLRQFYEFYV
jgi:hypothetical protein